MEKAKQHWINHGKYEGRLVKINFDYNKIEMPGWCNYLMEAGSISKDEMFTQNIDIYAPCALGATLNNKNIESLSCDIIAGAANNQLEKEGVHDLLLKEKGILYAPDFLINAGGLINVYSELKNWNQEKTLQKTENIYDTTISILSRSEKEDISTHQAALSIAKERLSN